MDGMWKRRQWWNVTLTSTHLKIAWNEKGESKEALFELHPARPSGPFYGISSVTDKTGKEWNIAPTGDPVYWVAWPR